MASDPGVLIDLTVLSSPSRSRGIGRYVSDLAQALFRAAPADLSILGLCDLGWSGAGNARRDLATAVAELLARGQMQSHASWAYHVRLGLARAARRIRPALVHSAHPEATPLGRLGCPRVVTCHDLIELAYPDRYLGWRDGFRTGRLQLDRRRYRTADHVIAVSQATADDLMKLLDVPARRISVVHNGVDLRRWTGSSQPSDRETLVHLDLAERPFALYVGGADWRKNPDAMCEAIARAARELPDLVLAWAGSLKPGERAGVEAIARRHAVAERLRLLGYVDDAVLGALRRATVAELFVSRAEGFGYPVIEAMACGAPVITSARSSMQEIAGEAAVLVDPGDCEAIARSLVTLGRSEDERRRLRDAGVVHAQRYSVEKMAAGTLDVYRAVIGAFA